MTLRSRLALLFAAFAALPLAAALAPVSRALSGALAAEHAARLDGAAAAVSGELARLGEAAADQVRDLARGPEAEAFARDREEERIDPVEEAARAAEWARARDLDVLAVLDAEGRVISSAHLPGRAGDVDPDLAPLVAGSPPGRPAPRLVARATEAGVERGAALVAWEEGPGDPPLRIAGGVALGAALAARLAALTSGEIVLRDGGGAVLAEAAAPGGAGPSGWRRALARLSGLSPASRELLLGPPDAPVARVEVAAPSAGLARAQATVLLAFLAALAAGTAAAALAGRVIASRITRPVEALQAAAARVAAGDLGARVEVRATGEVGELVRAWNAMVKDLAEGRDRLAQAERVAAWREVARRLAHEIKNPLTPIAMSVETLRDARAAGRADFPEIFEEGTRAIGEEVRRLKRIVDEFSRFARLPAPDRAEVRPEDLVAQVLALLATPPPGVEVVREVEAGLPEVLADRDQIVQVLWNLVRNGLDAMPSGGRLAVAARRAGGEVAFEVTDAGPGIAPADRERIFEPYFTTKAGGTGLGLAIARRIAEEHGGRLEAAAGAAGAGARLVLTLPAAPRPPGLTGPASP